MQDGRGNQAATEPPPSADGPADARGDARRRVSGRGRGSETPRRRQTRRAGRDATGTGDNPAGRPNDAEADLPVLPPPLGDAGHAGAAPAPAGAHDTRPGGARSGDRSASAVGEPPDPMRVIEILSHELRSPITTIHLGTKVLREQGHRISRPVRAEVVEAVEEEAERLYRLVEDLLAVARHDHGAVPLPVGPLLLQHWLPPVIAAEVQASPALNVRASIPADLPPVLVDDGALAQVIRNLLGNAVRYAPQGMPLE